MIKRQHGFTIIEAVISLTILLLIAGVIMGSITNIYRSTNLSDNTMLVSSQNARAMSEIREDLLQTSRNFQGIYAPFLDAGTSELRFRRISGFNATSGAATFENQYACYWLDTSTDILYRRFRNLGGTLLSNPAPEPIGAYVTAFNPSVDTDACTVTISVTTSRGKTELNEDASTTRSITITPFNVD